MYLNLVSQRRNRLWWLKWIFCTRFYRFILFGGTVGSGEAYMQGTWQSPDLTRVIEVMVMNLATLANMNKRWQRFASCLGVWRYYWQKILKPVLSAISPPITI